MDEVEKPLSIGLPAVLYILSATAAGPWLDLHVCGSSQAMQQLAGLSLCRRNSTSWILPR
jgi:hypothetical protein